MSSETWEEVDGITLEKKKVTKELLYYVQLLHFVRNARVKPLRETLSFRGTKTEIETITYDVSNDRYWSDAAYKPETKSEFIVRINSECVLEEVTPEYFSDGYHFVHLVAKVNSMVNPDVQIDYYRLANRIAMPRTLQAFKKSVVYTLQKEEGCLGPVGYFSGRAVYRRSLENSTVKSKKRKKPSNTNSHSKKEKTAETNEASSATHETTDVVPKNEYGRFDLRKMKITNELVWIRVQCLDSCKIACTQFAECLVGFNRTEPVIRGCVILKREIRLLILCILEKSYLRRLSEVKEGVRLWRRVYTRFKKMIKRKRELIGE